MNTIKTNAITITDSYVKRAQDHLVHYLLSMKSEKFLFEVFKVANLKPLTNEGYQGWERSDQINFRGHFFGHYMSALALAYYAEKNNSYKKQLLEQMQVAVAGFLQAQENYALNNPKSAGYISAFRESALDEVEGKSISPEDKENVLVPWYNLHKILAGLLDIHESLKGIEEKTSQAALKVASQFGDYIYNRMMKLADKNNMLQIEYGGMNDALYHLFELTKQKKHMIAATYFDEDELFKKLAKHENVLPGKHANTQIPKLIGALKRYQVFQDEDLYSLLSVEEREKLTVYFTAAKNFWDIVVNYHTYCTGGNSQSEHFHEPNSLYHDAEVRNGDCTCETCNTHNMLKLTRNLYFLTKDPKYLDYYEKTYINAILASQNPEDGMMMYFQPMGAGYNKIYNRPYDEFWCCTGTGVESFAKLADTYYFQTDKHILVNLYFSNEVSIIDNNIRFVQQSDRKNSFSTFTTSAINEDAVKPIYLALRIPAWTAEFEVFHNDVKTDFELIDGFAYLKQPIGQNETVMIKFAPYLKMVSAMDNPNYVAFEHGPYVLAGGLGTENVSADHPNGIIVRVGTKERLLPDALTMTADDWRENFQEYMRPVEREDNLFAFQADNIEEQITFTPYYEMHGERYGIYFKLLKADSKTAQEALKKKEEWIREQELILAELHNFDENNSEYAKKLTYKQSEVGAFLGRRYRKAFKNGWFSYEFTVHTKKDFYLQLDFHRDDVGKQMDLILNGQETRTMTVNGKVEGEFISQHILLDKALLLKEGNMKLTFKTIEEETPRIFGITFLTS
ncbi:glycoside hydrolase family 127 protein [Bacillus sp. SD088]|uniref:glycoside hydrolase family 127 protein n=1 Tax=Bacillus sp. SD088 TaxID=2782012 RepID=UPI001A96BCCC|nr:beta-L-arabinofuranosidase domain-containing protein [Bacillus sp. SD088]MBO0995644.1 glycoside hydrolase family 127 protein [Bacillus sp. SD088]